jgi:hypothetical protein
VIYGRRVNAAAHDGSAWAHAIVAPVPTTPVGTARAALAVNPDLGDTAGAAGGGPDRGGLAEVKRAVRDPATGPAELCRLLRRERWIFGGHLLPWPEDVALPGEAIPLLQFDGTLHVVSVEPPGAPDVFTAAVDRARTILRTLDDERASIGERLGIAYGRVLVTIVVGDPAFVTEPDAGRIRALNALSSGITVMTYEALITIAERTSDALPD